MNKNSLNKKIFVILLIVLTFVMIVKGLVMINSKRFSALIKTEKDYSQCISRGDETMAKFVFYGYAIINLRGDSSRETKDNAYKYLVDNFEEVKKITNPPLYGVDFNRTKEDYTRICESDYGLRLSLYGKNKEYIRNLHNEIKQDKRVSTVGSGSSRSGIFSVQGMSILYCPFYSDLNQIFTFLDDHPGILDISNTEDGRFYFYINPILHPIDLDIENRKVNFDQIEEIYFEGLNFGSAMRIKNEINKMIDKTGSNINFEFYCFNPMPL